MNIKKATTEHLPELLRLDAMLDAYRSTIFEDENIDFHKRTKPHDPFNKKDLIDGLVFVAEDEKENVLGFIRGSIETRKNHVLSSLGYIDELFVTEEARGQGLASKLFEALKAEFKQQGCDHMTTHTDAENNFSRSFYKKIGMSEVTVEFWKKI